MRAAQSKSKFKSVRARLACGSTIEYRVREVRARWWFECDRQDITNRRCERGKERTKRSLSVLGAELYVGGCERDKERKKEPITRCARSSIVRKKVNLNWCSPRRTCAEDVKERIILPSSFCKRYVQYVKQRTKNYVKQRIMNHVRLYVFFSTRE